MKYSCGCPERMELNEEQIKEAREPNKKKLEEIEKSLTEGIEGKSDSAFNACKNQQLNLLRNTGPH